MIADRKEVIMHISRFILFFNLVLMLSLTGCEPSNAERDDAVARRKASDLATVAKIADETVYPLQIQGELSDTFLPYSDYTDLQRDKMTERVVGRVVQWTLPVYEISRSDGIYLIRTRSIPKLLTVYAYVKARGIEDDALLESLKTNDFITLKGRISEISLRTVLVLSPAIVIIEPNQSQEIPISRDTPQEAANAGIPQPASANSDEKIIPNPPEIVPHRSPSTIQESNNSYSQNTNYSAISNNQKVSKESSSTPPMDTQLTEEEIISLENEKGYHGDDPIVRERLGLPIRLK